MQNNALSPEESPKEKLAESLIRSIYQECRKAIEQRKTIQPRLLMKKIEQHYLEHYREKTTD